MKIPTPEELLALIDPEVLAAGEAAHESTRDKKFSEWTQEERQATIALTVAKSKAWHKFINENNRILPANPNTPRIGAWTMEERMGMLGLDIDGKPLK